MAGAADEERCWVEGCRGARFGGTPECFAHLGDDARAKALSKLHPGADVDLRDTELTDALLQQLLRAVRNDDGDGDPELGSARFDGARFTDRADFADVTFTGRARFVGSHWGDADFHGAGFAGSASFDDAVFDGKALFRNARFEDGGHFWRCTFHGATTFFGAVFTGTAAFARCTFADEASFADMQAKDVVESREMSFEQGADFTGTTFEQAGRLGPLRSPGTVTFDRCLFSRPVTIDADVDQLSFIGARFADTAVLRLQRTRLWLDGAILQGSTTVVSADIPPPDEDDVAPEDPGPDPLPLHERELPLGSGSVVALRGVDAGKVVLSGVDLSRCRFRGAYNLDKLRIQGRCRFADTPRGVRLGWGWLPVWWWTRRQTIVEEHRWRSRRPRRTEGWSSEYPTRPGGTIGWGQPTHAEGLAAIYRQLRKAFEDAKDEPGAADFYYGEMEMRRLSPTTPRSERLVLTLYWLFSGYGLRASRALLGLVGLVAVTTWLLTTRGFVAPGTGVEEALRSALNAVVFRTSTESLTTTGAYTEMVARLFGPILLALAVLSVRNRVKR